MNVLVVGRGGREHSMIMKLTESEQVDKLYAAPGNGGMESQAECLNIDETDVDALVQFAKENQIDFTIVGPEKSLAKGIANRFQEEGLAIFAPRKEAALLEESKSFAKSFMKRHGIPTADYETFTDVHEAKSYIERKGAPIVVKADGLAAGKGVVVAQTKQEAMQALDDMLVSKVFSDAGSTVVVEDFLDGKEFSLMAFVHKNQVYPMVTARDYKRAFDDDQGPNTGGMGAYAPVPDVSEETLAYTMEKVLQQTADGMVDEGRSFTGILYAGMIMTVKGPKVIEYNTRFGDPETQVVLPLLKNDLLQVMLDVRKGKDPQLKWHNESCVGVVLASKGYPTQACDKHIQLPEMASSEQSFIVYAGTKKSEQGLVSDGGRVLLVGAKDTTLKHATTRVYHSFAPLSDDIDFFYRKDIGQP